MGQALNPRSTLHRAMIHPRRHRLFAEFAPHSYPHSPIDMPQRSLLRVPSAWNTWIRLQVLYSANILRKLIKQLSCDGCQDRMGQALRQSQHHRFLIFHITRANGRNFYLRVDRRDPNIPFLVFRCSDCKPAL